MLSLSFREKKNHFLNLNLKLLKNKSPTNVNRNKIEAKEITVTLIFWPQRKRKKKEFWVMGDSFIHLFINKFWIFERKKK